MSKARILDKEHFLHENQTWGRALDYYLQENAYLKTRLSQVVDRNTDKIFVAQAEIFNNNFIQNDEYIRDLKNDVSASELLIKKALGGTPTDEEKIFQKQRKLRNEIDHFEKKFASLIEEFNKYLLSLV